MFYDLHILSKEIYEHYSNALQVIGNIIKDKEYFLLNSLIDLKLIDVEKFGFITLKSNKMYEILTYTKNECSNFMEQCNKYNNDLIDKKTKYSLVYLKNIEILTPKLLTMVYVSLLNINAMLIKHYKSKNLIEDIVAKNIKRLSVFINQTKKNYEEKINNPKLVDKYTNKPYTKEEKKGYKEDLDYINYVLSEWILDFKLSKNIRK